MEDENCCEICFENFNETEKVPKIMECCNKRFCLQCLKDIFKKNGEKILCPICRKITNKNPGNLKMDKLLLEPKTICPACKKPTSSQNLKFRITNMGVCSILCSSCCPSSDVIYLKDYLTNLSEEMNYFMTKFCSLDNKETLGNTLEFQIKNYLDDFMDVFKDTLKIKIKQKITDLVNQHYKINLNNMSNFIFEFDTFKEFSKQLNHLNDKEIKTTDYVEITSAIEFYINKSEMVRLNGMKLKQIFDELNKNSLLFFDENFTKLSELENFMCNLISIQIDNQIYDNLKQNDEKNVGLNTGIDFIDRKFMILRQDNEKLNNLIIKKDNEVKRLETELQMLKNSLKYKNNIGSGNNNYSYFENKILSTQKFYFAINQSQNSNQYNNQNGIHYNSQNQIDNQKFYNNFNTGKINNEFNSNAIGQINNNNNFINNYDILQNLQNNQNIYPNLDYPNNYNNSNCVNDNTHNFQIFIKENTDSHFSNIGEYISPVNNIPVNNCFKNNTNDGINNNLDSNTNVINNNLNTNSGNVLNINNLDDLLNSEFIFTDNFMDKLKFSKLN